MFVCLFLLVVTPLSADESLDEEVQAIMELSVTAPWQASQSRIEALRWRFDQLSPRQRHQLALVEARNRLIAGSTRTSLRDLRALLEEDLDPDLRVRAHVLASNAATFLELHEDAFRHIGEAQELLQEVDEPKARADVYGRVSVLFHRVNEFDQAVQFAAMAVEAAHATGDDREVCAEKVQYANAQHNHPGIDVAVVRESLDSARNACRQAGDPLFIAITENMDGQAMLLGGDVNQAVAQLEYALELMKAVDFPTGIRAARLYLAQAHFQAGQVEAALEIASQLPNEFAAANQWRKATLSHLLLSDIALEQGDYAGANNALVKANEARDRQYEDEQTINTAYLQVRFETGMREYERRVAQSERAREQLFRNSALGGSGLLFLLGIALLRRYRTRVKVNKRIERKSRELASLGEIAHSINARRDADGVLSALLRGGIRVVPEAVQGEVMVRDWFRRQFRWVGIQGSGEPASLPLPVSADQAIAYYVKQARELAPGLYLRNGPVLRRSARSLPGQHKSRLEGSGERGALLILALTSGEELEGFLVLILEERPEATQTPDADRLLRLRSHAIAALSRWQQLEELGRERHRADEALADLRLTHGDLQAAMRESLEAAENKGRFLAQVSHELRTPLHAVNGYSQKLRRGIRDQDQPKASRYAEQLSSASAHLLALIDDLMDISRMEAGQAPVSLVPTNLNRLAEEVAGMLRPQMEKGGTRLHIHLPNNLGVVMMDEVKVRQILLNLLSNAARFTDHGNVTLSMAVKPPVDSGGDRTFELQVSDDGIGIAPEDQERIFDAFSQANSDIERRSGGTGLGLAVTRNLCELLQGDIRLDSEPGKGTVFTVSLPLPTDENTGVAFPRALEEVGEGVGPFTDRRRRLFIVEDNRINRELMEEYLRLEGFEVASAGTGEEALEKIPEAEPDIVLMDMNLPGIQGDETTRLLKAREETSGLTIIAVSAYTGADIRKRAMDAGCREYHTKPVDFPSLVKRMRELLP